MSSLRCLATFSLIVLVLPISNSGCTLPHGSFARPIDPVALGRSMVSVGGMIPFAAAGSGDDVSFSGVAEEVTVVPAAAYDIALNDERTYFGVEISLLNQVTSTSETEDTSAFSLFVNPRFETPIAESWSFTVDGNLGYFSTGDSGIPFIEPSVGVRGYFGTGWGGFILSQQLSTAFITVALPGSVAYDIPIPLGETATLHIFPEVRWDPTVFFAGDTSGVVSLFSGGGTLMFEL